VLAGALAALTAAVLASTFGVEGTITGAAFGSVVATVGGTWYAWSLERTHHRLRPKMENIASIARSKADKDQPATRTVASVAPTSPTPVAAGQDGTADSAQRASGIGHTFEESGELRRRPRWLVLGIGPGRVQCIRDRHGRAHRVRGNHRQTRIGPSGRRQRRRHHHQPSAGHCPDSGADRIAHRTDRLPRPDSGEHARHHPDNQLANAHPDPDTNVHPDTDTTRRRNSALTPRAATSYTVCASEMTRCTPCRPRAFQRAQELGPERA
jgi:hypothetical protein